MYALSNRLGISTFDQYAEGTLSFEDEKVRFSESRDLSLWKGCIELKAT